MRPATRCAALVALLAALAGCTGDDEPDDGMDDADPDDGMGDERPVPETLTFDFGPGLGCDGSSAGPDACLSWQAGPDGPAIDAVWVSLDESYWGLPFTTTIESATGDSDCIFVSDAMEPIGDANQGADVCAGEVPDRTAWLFLYSYVEPHLGMTLTLEAPEA